MRLARPSWYEIKPPTETCRLSASVHTEVVDLPQGRTYSCAVAFLHERWQLVNIDHTFCDGTLDVLILVLPVARLQQKHHGEIVIESATCACLLGTRIHRDNVAATPPAHIILARIHICSGPSQHHAVAPLCYQVISSVLASVL
jgi:hypothetical protein